MATPSVLLVGDDHVALLTALRCAQKNYSVTLLSPQLRVGQGTSSIPLVVSSSVHDIVPSRLLRDAITTVFTKLVIHGPSTKTEVSIHPHYVLNQAQLRRSLSAAATDAGVSLVRRAKYLSNNATTVVAKDPEEKSLLFTPDILIGAHTENRRLAKKNALRKRNPFLSVHAAIIESSDEAFHFYPHIGAYAWYCPLGKNRACICVVAHKGTDDIFTRFSKQFSSPILSSEKTTIPLSTPRTKKKKIYSNGMQVHVVGHEAGHLNDVFAWDCFFGVRAATALAEKLSGGSQVSSPHRYDVLLTRSLHRMLQQFSGKEIDYAVTICAEKTQKNILHDPWKKPLFSSLKQATFHHPSLYGYLPSFLKSLK